MSLRIDSEKWDDWLEVHVVVHKKHKSEFRKWVKGKNSNNVHYIDFSCDSLECIRSDSVVIVSTVKEYNKVVPRLHTGYVFIRKSLDKKFCLKRWNGMSLKQDILKGGAVWTGGNIDNVAQIKAKEINGKLVTDSPIQADFTILEESTAQNFRWQHTFSLANGISVKTNEWLTGKPTEINGVQNMLLLGTRVCIYQDVVGDLKDNLEFYLRKHGAVIVNQLESHCIELRKSIETKDTTLATQKSHQTLKVASLGACWFLNMLRTNGVIKSYDGAFIPISRYQKPISEMPLVDFKGQRTCIIGDKGKVSPNLIKLLEDKELKNSIVGEKDWPWAHHVIVVGTTRLPVDKNTYTLSLVEHWLQKASRGQEKSCNVNNFHVKPLVVLQKNKQACERYCWRFLSGNAPGSQITEICKSAIEAMSGRVVSSEEDYVKTKDRGPLIYIYIKEDIDDVKRVAKNYKVYKPALIVEFGEKGFSTDLLEEHLFILDEETVEKKIDVSKQLIRSEEPCSSNGIIPPGLQLSGKRKDNSTESPNKRLCPSSTICGSGLRVSAHLIDIPVEPPNNGCTENDPHTTIHNSPVITPDTEDNMDVDFEVPERNSNHSVSKTLEKNSTVPSSSVSSKDAPATCNNVDKNNLSDISSTSIISSGSIPVKDGSLEIGVDSEVVSCVKEMDVTESIMHWKTSSKCETTPTDPLERTADSSQNVMPIGKECEVTEEEALDKKLSTVAPSTSKTSTTESMETGANSTQDAPSTTEKEVNGKDNDALGTNSSTFQPCQGIAAPLKVSVTEENLEGNGKSASEIELGNGENNVDKTISLDQGNDDVDQNGDNCQLVRTQSVNEQSGVASNLFLSQSNQPVKEGNGTNATALRNESASEELGATGTSVSGMADGEQLDKKEDDQINHSIVTSDTRVAATSAEVQQEHCQMERNLANSQDTPPKLSQTSSSDSLKDNVTSDNVTGLLKDCNKKGQQLACAETDAFTSGVEPLPTETYLSGTSLDLQNETTKIKGVEENVDATRTNDLTKVLCDSELEAKSPCDPSVIPLQISSKVGVSTANSVSTIQSVHTSQSTMTDNVAQSKSYNMEQKNEKAEKELATSKECHPQMVQPQRSTSASATMAAHRQYRDATPRVSIQVPDSIHGITHNHQRLSGSLDYDHIVKTFDNKFGAMSRLVFTHMQNLLNQPVKLWRMHPNLSPVYRQALDQLVREDFVNENLDANGILAFPGNGMILCFWFTYNTVLWEIVKNILKTFLIDCGMEPLLITESDKISFIVKLSNFGNIAIATLTKCEMRCIARISYKLQDVMMNMETMPIEFYKLKQIVYCSHLANARVDKCLAFQFFDDVLTCKDDNMNVPIRLECRGDGYVDVKTVGCRSIGTVLVDRDMVKNAQKLRKNEIQDTTVVGSVICETCSCRIACQNHLKIAQLESRPAICSKCLLFKSKCYVYVPYLPL